MSIRKKILFITSSILLLFLIISVVISIQIILTSFNSLELEKTNEQISFLERSILGEIEGLDATNGDWAPWDETFNFATQYNPEYIESNLDAETLANIRVSSMLFFNNNNELFHETSVNIEDISEINLSEEIIEYLKKETFFSKTNLENPYSGLLIINKQAFMVSSQVIRPNYYSNDIGGKLIMLRAINDQESQYLESLIDKNIKLYYSINDIPDLNSEEKETLIKDKRITKKINNNEIISFLLMPDMSNNNYLIIEQKHDRHIYQHGKNSVLFFLAIFVILIFFVNINIFYILNKTVLEKILKLNTELENIANNKNFSKRVSEDGKDEITTVQKNINSTLSALEASLTETQKAKNKLDEKTQMLKKANKELENTLEDFYTLRISMQRDIEKDVIEKENLKIKEKLDKLKENNSK